MSRTSRFVRRVRIALHGAEGPLVLALILLFVALAAVMALHVARSRESESERRAQQQLEQFDRQGRESREECLKSPGCDPSTRTTKPDPPQVIPARRQP